MIKNTKHKKKILIAIIIVVLFNICIPKNSYAGWEDAGGNVIKEICYLVIGIGDAVEAAFNKWVIGIGGWGDSMLDKSVIDLNLTNTDSKYYPGENPTPHITIKSGELSPSLWGKMTGESYKYPCIYLCPENIFSNKIAMLDVNFLNPNKYKNAQTGNIVEPTQKEDGSIEQNAYVSSAAYLAKTISAWYNTFRNIAIVGLLTVLVYLGIKIVLGATAEDKAQYKERLKDWVIALVLIFTMHYIMSAILMLTDQVINLFSNVAQGVIVRDESAGITLKMNMTELVRFQAQSESWQAGVSYTIIYFALIVITFRFFVQYLKRFLYMAFYTMISPLVALTYPIDRAGDGRSQAFNLWFKEYLVNALLQPIHLIIYTVLVSSSISIMANNPIFAIVAILFIWTAESFVKKLFGINSESVSKASSGFASGALTMKAFDAIKSGKSLTGGKIGKSTNSSSSKDSGAGGSDNGNDNIRFQSNNNDQLASYNDDSNDDQAERDDSAGQEDDKTHAMDYLKASKFGKKATEMTGKAAGFATGVAGKLGNQAKKSGKKLLKPAKKAGNFVSGKAGTLKDQLKNKSDAFKNNHPNLVGFASESSKFMKNKARKAAPKIKGAAKTAGKYTRKYAPTVLKGAGKTVLRGGMAVGGTMIGLGAAVGSGDASNILKYGAAGAVAGNVLGDRLSSGAGNAINKAKGIPGKFVNAANNIEYQYNKETYGREYATREKINKENEMDTKQFMNDKAEQKKWDKIAGEIGYEGSAQDIMECATDYFKAGITDEKLIKNAMKLEMDKGGKFDKSKHSNAVDIAKYSNKLGLSDKDFAKKESRENLQKNINSRVSDPGKQKEIMKKLAKLHGSEYLIDKSTSSTSSASRTSSNSNSGIIQTKGSIDGPRREGLI